MPRRVKAIKPLVICIPGVDGKDVLGELLVEYGSKFLAPVSHTSREMRPGEVDGKDFFFVDPAEIARMEKAGELIESTTIGDSTYATAKSSIATLVADGRVPLLDVDAPAAVSIQKTSLTACYVLLQPSSVEVFKQHLDAKKKYLPPQTDCVKITSNFETEYAKLAGIKFWDAVITDDDPKNALQELRSIVCRMCFSSD